MRTWRKIESSILTSGRLSRVSDSAKWLFTLLIVAQDDEGKYPHTEPRRKALTASTDWGSDVYDSLLSELRTEKIIELEDGFIHLESGAEKNGTPSNSKNYPVLYPMPEPSTETEAYETVRGRVARVEKSKSREDKKEKDSKKKEIDETVHSPDG